MFKAARGNAHPHKRHALAPAVAHAARPALHSGLRGGPEGRVLTSVCTARAASQDRVGNAVAKAKPTPAGTGFARRQTRAALEELGAISAPTRKVPFDGPPSLAIALELLEQSEREMQRMCSNDALIHARRAAAELRQALASK